MISAAPSPLQKIGRQAVPILPSTGRRTRGNRASTRPKLYRVGKGEQGVLICEPYKSELTPYWRFKTPVEARRSARKIYALFESYLDDGEFVGADMARKFLQMGRARRYANYKGGNKYDKANSYAPEERGTGDPKKAESAMIFHNFWKKAEAEPRYAAQKKEWKGPYG